MIGDTCHDILRAKGFCQVGNLDCDIVMALWWHEEHGIELAEVHLANAILFRGVKCYRVAAISENGETHSRHLKDFEADLIARFDEVHFHLSSFRQSSRDLATKRLLQKGFRCIGGRNGGDNENPRARLQTIADEIKTSTSDLCRDEKLFRLGGARSSLLRGQLQRRIINEKRKLQQLREEQKRLAVYQDLTNRLEEEYKGNASVFCLLTQVPSTIQIAWNSEEIHDVTDVIIKELRDLDRYVIRQKFGGNRFQVMLEAVASPGISLLTRWTAGVFSPRQLEGLTPEFTPFKKEVEKLCDALPRKDIVLGGSVKDPQNLLAARVVRNFLEKVKKVSRPATKTPQSPSGRMPVWMGQNVLPDDRLDGSWELPLDRCGHIYCSGKTGSGKTVAAYVIVEGAAANPHVAITVIDAEAQWCGLVVPEDRTKILSQYADFGLEPSQAQGFDFECHVPAFSLGEPLPENLTGLSCGRRIISCKGMDDRSRCELCAKVLDAVIRETFTSEADSVRHVIVLDELFRWFRKGVAKNAQEAAHEVERYIEWIAREGRKYGDCLLLIGQSNRDLSHTLSVTRQNITTRIVLANSDREIEHLATILDDPKQIASLKTAEALVVNPAWGVAKIRIRPPLSKAFEPANDDLRKILTGSDGDVLPKKLSDIAQTALDIVREKFGQTGQPIRFSEVIEQLGLTSRRRIQEIITELQRSGEVTLKKLPQRGNPLIVAPVGRRT